MRYIIWNIGCSSFISKMFTTECSTGIHDTRVYIHGHCDCFTNSDAYIKEISKGPFDGFTGCHRRLFCIRFDWNVDWYHNDSGHVGRHFWFHSKSKWSGCCYHCGCCYQYYCTGRLVLPQRSFIKKIDFTEIDELFPLEICFVPKNLLVFHWKLVFFFNKVLDLPN